MIKLLHRPSLIPVNRNLFKLLCCLLLLCWVPQAGADTTVGGTISTDTTWTLSGSPYIVTSNIIVKGTDGADGITTLTIEPGAVVKFDQSSYMDIGASYGDPGALIAQGTASEPIVFTSNQASPAPGDWNYIRFYNTADDATTVLDHCSIQYAGGGNQGALNIQQASPTISNTTVSDSSSYGIRLSTGSPVVDTCQFSGNGNYDLYYTGTVGGTVAGTTINTGISLFTATNTVAFSGNTINYNNSYPIKVYANGAGPIVSGSSFGNVDAGSYISVSGYTISQDATWTADVPYAISGVITVKGTDGADGITTLTVLPGAVLKFDQSSYMDIGASYGDPGALIAQGTSENQIVFTSNQAAPAPGDWDYIRFYNTADDNTCVLDNCIVDYGGRTNGAVYLYDASPRIQNSTLRNSKTAGIYGRGTGSGTATLDCNTFNGNVNGIYWITSPAPEMHENNFTGNTSYGIYYTGAQSLNAEDNWWGDAAGPNGGGDAVYGNVDADPWSSSEHACASGSQNYPPYAPSAPSPEDSAVHVASDTGVTLSWTCQDPNAQDTLTYDFYWGLSADALQLEAAGLADATYLKTGLLPGTTYFWQVRARDSGGLSTDGPVWHFTTEGDPPDLVVTDLFTSPAGGIPVNSWTTLTATVANNGTGPAVDGFSTQFSADGNPVGTKTFDQILYPGDSIQLSLNWYYTGGDPLLSVNTDSLDTVAETDEDNNQLDVALFAVADMVPPELIAQAPADGAFLQQIAQITVTLNDSRSAVDDAAVMTSFLVTDAAQQSVGGIVAEDNDTFTFTPASPPLADGVYQVDLTAADEHGNSQAVNFSFTIDTVAPAQPTITGAEVASGLIQPRPVQNTADRVIAVLEGTREQDTSVWCNGLEFSSPASAPWSHQIELSPGDNAFEIYCTDRAGNQGPSIWADIYLDAQAGVIYHYDASGRMIGVDSN